MHCLTQTHRFGAKNTNLRNKRLSVKTNALKASRRKNQTKDFGITIALFAIGLALTLINVVVGALLDKFLIEKQKTAWKTILTDSYLEQMEMKEDFCHDLRQINVAMFQIYDANEFRLIVEFFLSYESLPNKDIEIEDFSKLPKYYFLLKMIEFSESYMIKTEEYYCKMNYDIFGEQRYLETRLKSFQNPDAEPGMGGSILQTVKFFFARSFTFMANDSIWARFSTFNALFIQKQNQFFTKIHWNELIESIAEQKIPGVEINLVGLGKKSKLQDPFNYQTVGCIINGDSKSCTKKMVTAHAESFFNSFKAFVASIQGVKTLYDICWWFTNLYPYLAITFKLHFILSEVVTTFSKENAIHESFNRVEDIWNKIKSDCEDFASEAFKFFKNYSYSLTPKNQKELMYSSKSLLDKISLMIFDPLAKLQIKKNFWQIVIGTAQGSLSFAKIVQSLLITIVSKLLELVVGVFLAGVLVKCVTGVIQIIKTVYTKLKTYYTDKKNMALEQQFIQGNLFPNLQFHLKYTKCSIYRYYQKLLTFQLESMDLITSQLGSSQNKQYQQKKPYFLDYNVNYAFNQFVSIPQTRFGQFIEQYLSKKCNYSSSFCRILLSTKILDNKDFNFLGSVSIDGLKHQVKTNLMAGPISRVMLIRNYHNKSFSARFLQENNFYMHATETLNENDKEYSLVYCRSCSSYVLRDYNQMKYDTSEVQNNIPLLSNNESPDYDSKDNFDSTSVYLIQGNSPKPHIKSMVFRYTNLFVQNEKDDMIEKYSSLANAIMNSYTKFQAGSKILLPVFINLNLSLKFDNYSPLNFDLEHFHFYDFTFAGVTKMVQFKVLTSVLNIPQTLDKLKGKKVFITNTLEFKITQNSQYDAIELSYIEYQEIEFAKSSVFFEDLPLKYSYKTNFLSDQNSGPIVKKEVTLFMNDDQGLQGSKKCQGFDLQQGNALQIDQMKEYVRSDSPCSLKTQIHELSKSICENCKFAGTTGFKHSYAYFARLDKSNTKVNFIKTMNSLVFNLYPQMVNVVENPMSQISVKLIPLPQKLPNLEQFSTSFHFGGNGIFFHELKPSTDKTGKMMKFKYIMGDKFKLVEENNVFNDDSRFIFPMKYSSSECELVYRLIQYLGEGGSENKFDNAIYEIIEAPENGNFELDEEEGEGIPSPDKSPELLKESDFKLNSNLSIEFEEFSKIVLTNIGQAMKQVYSFSNVPKFQIYYLELSITKNSNNEGYSIDYYEETGILKSELIDSGYVPIWPKFAPQFSRLESTTGREVPNRGNFFFTLWIQQENVFETRFWVKFKYNDFDNKISQECKVFEDVVFEDQKKRKKIKHMIN